MLQWRVGGRCAPSSPPPTRYEYFLKGAQLPSVAMTGGKQNFPGLANSDTWWARGLRAGSLWEMQA